MTDKDELTPTCLDEVIKIKSLLALMCSVDWGSPFIGADQGADYLQGQILHELDSVIERLDLLDGGDS